LGSKASIQQFVRRLHHFGKVDVLVNNAGILNGKQKNQDFNTPQVMGVNFAGPFLLTRLLGPLLLKGKARIINVTSALGLLPDEFDLTFQGEYMQSKLALILMTACLRKQNLDSSCVHPGVVQSNILDFKTSLRPWMKTVEEGAVTISMLASGSLPCDHLYFGPSGEHRDTHPSCKPEIFWEKASALVGLRP
ncbi:MAG: SDR family NAD(P)-dependent oxidoreductase, partial [Gammaproteobacteria bacterium]|nr:SDR family NAD(P)-dependent oxidoreductase [Gammaproteobacteria bacterium]